MICTIGDIWQPTVPDQPGCVDNCDDPGTPLHGYQDSSSTYEAFQSVLFYCDESYSLVGAQILTCAVIDSSSKTTWDNHVPQCMSNCIAPGIPVNGKADTPIVDVYHNGDVLRLSCDESYTLIGSDVITCNDGVWSDRLPECQNIYPCSSNPCSDGSTCLGLYSSYACQCATGITGTHCDEGE
ncbi:C4b-binding protein alpha chain-like [Saccoglossus kowalevskii]